MSDHSSALSVLIAAVVISTGLDKLHSLTVFGGINISLQIIVLFLAAFYAMAYIMTADRMRLNTALLLSILLLLSYFVFAALRSDQPERSLTYFMMLCLCMFVFIVFSSTVNRHTLTTANKLVFLVGTLLIAAQFSRYIYILLFTQEKILSNRSLWDVGSNDVYEVIHGRHIAFQGFSGDPNLVGAAISIVLFCGMAVRFRKADVLRHVLNVFLIVVLVSSYSRGAIAALLITYFIVGVVLKHRQYRGYFYSLMLVIAAGVLFIMLAGDQSISAVNPLAKFQYTFGRRFDEWGGLIARFADNPILGCGLRCDEIVLGKYAENTYLGLLLNAGILGLFLYALVVFTVYFLFFSKARRIMASYDEYSPWFAYATYLLSTMLFVSMDVKIHFWVTLSILASAVLYRSFATGADIKVRRI